MSIHPNWLVIAFILMLAAGAILIERADADDPHTWQLAVYDSGTELQAGLATISDDCEIDLEVVPIWPEGWNNPRSVVYTVAYSCP